MADEQIPSGLNDIGTRYEHLCEYRDSLDMCVRLISERGATTPDARQRLMKFSVALEVINTTIDAFAGIRAAGVEYQLYRQINSIPSDPESIPATRGTKLR